MAISVRDWVLSIKQKKGKTSDLYVEMYQAVEELKTRELAFNTCVNMIANAVGRCEFKTYRNHKECMEREYHLLNIEPNFNQNSTAFFHKFIYRLFRDGEVLAVDEKRNGKKMLFVADNYTIPEEQGMKMNEYRDVEIEGRLSGKIYKENDVLHLRLNHKNIVPVINGLYESYSKLASAAAKSYKWESGKHFKVHVGQIAQGGEGWAEEFQKMMEAQLKPFIESDSAVLPEFDGYTYENLGNDGGKSKASQTTRDIRALVDDIFVFTARAFCIPPVLLFGDVAGTQDAMQRWLTTCIDPLCDQIQEEIVRKWYSYDDWKKGNFVRIDTSGIMHFDLFANAANVEKLIGSGAFSINDILKAARLSTINEPWADEHFMTKNIGNIEQVNMKGGE